MIERHGLSLNLFADDRTGAILSPDRKYRYRLWRAWDQEKPRLVFIMLNPSTADEIEPDPTITRCIVRARGMGFGGLEVVNLFAWRSTSPRVLKQIPDPVGPGNDQHIFAVCETAMDNDGMIILGWGEYGKLFGRGDALRRMLNDRQINTYALAMNDSGHPKHPLYVGYAEEPIYISPWAKEESTA